MSLRVLHRLLLRGKGDYLIVVGAPVEDVRAGAGSDSQPGLRTGQILWSGFSPGRKVLAADAELRAGEASRFLPLRLRAAGTGDRYSLTITNATTVAQVAYAGKGFPVQLARLLDDTRRESLAGVSADDEVRVGGRPRARAQGPGPDHRAPARRGLAAVSERAGLGSRRHRPRQDRLLRRGARATRGPRRCAWRCAEAEVRLACGSSPGRRGSCARYARRVRRAGSPPSAGGRFPADVLLRRLIDTRMQLVRSDQYQAFLSNPDPQGTSHTVYVYETAVGTGPQGRFGRAVAGLRRQRAGAGSRARRLGARRRGGARLLGAQLAGSDQLHPEAVASGGVPLYLTETEVAELLAPADALEAVEASFRRLAAGEIENVPARRRASRTGSSP